MKYKNLWLTVTIFTLGWMRASGDMFETLPEPYFSKVASGFTFPTGIVDAKDTMVVLERDGRVLDMWTKQVILDISQRVEDGYISQGFLGLAFPPQNSDTHFYVYYTREGDGATVVSRFHFFPDSFTANPDSEEVIIIIDQPYLSHNTGTIHFGPDGYLYIACGDGGSSYDPRNVSQSKSSLLGNILRIDVENVPSQTGYVIPEDNPFVGDPNSRDEIYFWGLRNPWGFSFDRYTGDVWVTDVGQVLIEEVNFIKAGTGAGSNFGWDFYEGSYRNRLANAGVAPPFEDTVAPVFEYTHDDPNGGFAVIGGVVCRGSRFPRLEGRYIFSDYVSRNFWTLTPNNSGSFRPILHTKTPGNVVTHGQNASGDVFLATKQGFVYLLEDTLDHHYMKVVASAPDANGYAEVNWGVKEGESYRLQYSTDLINWNKSRDPQLATRNGGKWMNGSVDVSGLGGRLFFRIERIAEKY